MFPSSGYSCANHALQHYHVPPRSITATPSAPARYVLAPQRLTDDNADNLVALGLYSLVGLLYVRTKEAVPLSDRDIMRYDTSLCRGSVKKAFDRLVDKQLLVKTKTAGGKSAYTPTWGPINGAARPWDLAATTQLGKPRHLRALKLDQRLLDTCLGKLTPRAQAPAKIERWVETPLLTLRDVGAYLLTLGGQPTSTPALTRFGLIRANQAQPLPDDATLLQQAQQSTIEQPAVALTIKGERRLFFRAETMIPTMIPHGRANENENSPQQRDETTQANLPDRSLRNLRNLKRVERDLATKSSANQEQVYEVNHIPWPFLPLTPMSRLLSALGAYPQTIFELADLPSSWGLEALADGLGRAKIKSLVGWVVARLRARRDHEWVPAPPKRLPSHTEVLLLVDEAIATGVPIVAGGWRPSRDVDISKYTTGMYASLFIRGGGEDALREENTTLAPYESVQEDRNELVLEKESPEASAAQGRSQEAFPAAVLPPAGQGPAALDLDVGSGFAQGASVWHVRPGAQTEDDPSYTRSLQSFGACWIVPHNTPLQPTIGPALSEQKPRQACVKDHMARSGVDDIRCTDTHASVHTPGSALTAPQCEPPLKVGSASEGELSQTWASVLTKLQIQVVRSDYDRHLKQTRLLAINGDIAVIGVLTAQSKEAMEDRFIGPVRRFLSDIYAQSMKLRVVITHLPKQL